MSEPRATQTHLNGGPRDDQYIVVEGYELRVARQEWPTLAEPPPSATVPFCSGRYRARRDSNGDLVPHDLTGTVEFDWAGWDGGEGSGADG